MERERKSSERKRGKCVQDGEKEKVSLLIVCSNELDSFGYKFLPSTIFATITRITAPSCPRLLSNHLVVPFLLHTSLLYSKSH